MAFHGYLHPRLPKAVAIDQMERFRCLPIEEIQEIAAKEDFSHEMSIFAPVGADRVDSSQLADLRKRMLDAATACGLPDTPSGERGVKFDRLAARVYMEDRVILPGEAAAMEFWYYQSLALMPDIAFWRWRDPVTMEVNDERLLGTDLTRHAFAKPWWRGYLLTAGKDDGLDDLDRLLASIGEADMDQIHSRRDAYGGNPVVYRALVEAAGRFPETPKMSQRELLRDVLKRILRDGAFIQIDSLGDEGIRELISHAIDASTNA